jgi:hypothetical protein
VLTASLPQPMVAQTDASNRAAKMRLKVAFMENPPEKVKLGLDKSFKVCYNIS